MLGSVVLLTPAGLLVAVAALIPLAALALATRRVRRTREELRLPAPPAVSRAPLVLGLVAVVALLAVAAAQPAVRTRTTATVRTDAEAMFVIDVSRSMLASGSPSGATRLDRARRDAVQLRAEIPETPSGVATMTDRVLPSLLPNPDLGVFDQTVEHAIVANEPPPEDQSVVATTFGALGAIDTQNYFSPSAKERLVVVLTDGESRAFDATRVAAALGEGRGVHLVLVRVWKPAEAVYDAGRREPGYHENPAGGALVRSLADAAGGKAFGEGQLQAAGRAERAALGSGPTVSAGKSERTRTLAPFVALAALLPLLLVVGRRPPRRTYVRMFRRQTTSPAASSAASAR